MFQFQVKTAQTAANINNIPYKIKRVKLSYIIVGSGFPGFYDNAILDTFVFPRNSIMLQPVSGGPTLVDFKSPAGDSPFLYNPSLSNYQGCGAVKKDGNWIIETARCAKITATIFLTGIDFPVNAAAGGTNTFNLPSLAEKQIDLQGANAVFNADSTQDGLKLSITSAAVSFFQASFIVIGLR